jgi:TPR repeat protein
VVKRKRQYPNEHSTVDWAAEPDADGLRLAISGIWQDPRGTIKKLENYAADGSVQSMVYLGFAYQGGLVVERDWEKAELWYRRAADRGSIDASFRLATLLIERKQYNQARALLDGLAAKEFAPALYTLGQLYAGGRGIGKNIDLSRELWSRAAQAGHLPSKRNLSFLLMRGRFGILKIPIGFLMWVRGVIEAALVFSENPKSDRLRVR